MRSRWRCGALLFGGVCVLYPGQRPDPAVMAALVAEHRVSVMYLSGGLFNVIVDDYPHLLGGLRQLYVGGEVLSSKHVRLALERFPELRLGSAYGPVETMIFTTTQPLGAADAGRATVPIGGPLPGKVLHVLDDALRPVPDGVVGEAYVGGVGLAHGYLGRAALTAERFVADPSGGPGGRLYRTGDLVRRGPAGVLDFVARVDSQVKIRGNRVEPAQVEAVLVRHPAVARAAVVAEPDRAGGRRLVAHVVPAGQYDDDDLRAHMSAALPDFMVPSAYVRCTELPLTATGKLDTAALTAPGKRGAAEQHDDPAGWLPLTAAQRRLWLADQIDAGLAYLLPVLVRLRGEVDTEALRSALVDVVNRHEALRTLFALRDQEPRRRVLSPGRARPGFVVFPATAAEFDARIAEAAERSFDLAAEIPLRAVLLRDGTDEAVLVLMFHHIAVDGWSLVPLLRDLSYAYAARAAAEAPDLPPLPMSYTEHAAGQAALLGERTDPRSIRSRQLGYWRSRLAGLAERTRLPRRSRRGVPGRRADRVVRRLDAAAHVRLARLARDHRVTPFMVLHAGLSVVLQRSGAGVDVPIGVPVAGRAAQVADDLVGFFVNLLVLRVELSGAPTVAELLARVRAADLAAFAHRDVPFDEVVAELDPVRSAGRHPLVDVVLAVQNTLPPRFTLPGGTAEVEIGRPVAARFELLVDVTEIYDPDGRPGGLTMTVEYQREVFDPEVVRWLADALPYVLAAMASTPDAPVTALDVPAPPASVEAGEPPAAPLFRLPHDGIERRLAEIWSDALGVEQIGAHDNFFALGGSSLDAVRVAARIAVAERATVTAAQIFACPTIAELAGAVGGAVSGIPRVSRVPRVPRVSAGE